MTRHLSLLCSLIAGTSLGLACRSSEPAAREIHRLALTYTAYSYFRPSAMLIGKDPAAEAALREGGRSLLVSEALAEARAAYSTRAFCDVWPPDFADPETLEFSALCDCKDFGPNGSVRLLPWTHVDPSAWSLFDEGNVFRLERKMLADNPVSSERRQAILENAKRVLDEARLIDIMRHNNQVLDVVASATELGLVARPETMKDENRFVLLHFDTHSDLYVEEHLSKNTESIGDYVNVLVSRGIVDEVFWVLPDWSRRPEAEPILWSDEALDEEDIGGPYTNGPRLVELYVDEKGDIGFGKPVSRDVPVRRIVKYHRITIAELPPLTGERTFLDFDADYIGNSGYGTDGCINFNPTPSEIYRSFDAVFRKLEAVGASPEIATLSISPGYTPDNSVPVIEAFFQDVMEQTGHPDHLVAYRHVDEDGVAEGSRTVVREGPVLTALFELSVIDAHSRRPDGAIVLDETEDEYREALARIAPRAAALGGRPADLLLLLDELDGETDGVVDIAPLEERVETVDLEAEVKNHYLRTAE